MRALRSCSIILRILEWALEFEGLEFGILGEGGRVWGVEFRVEGARFERVRLADTRACETYGLLLFVRVAHQPRKLTKLPLKCQHLPLLASRVARGVGFRV